MALTLPSIGAAWSRDPFRLIHWTSLALCIVFLPWSTAFLSMAQMLMVLNWIAQGIAQRTMGKRLRDAFGTAPSFLFLSFFGIHVIGLLWTSPEGLGWGLDLVRILLPVLTFGMVLASTPRLSQQELRTLLLLGAWSAVLSTVASLILCDWGLQDYRARSVFISHIRLGLLLCFSITVFLFYLPRNRWGRAAHGAAALWALYYLNALGSVQGIFTLGVLAMYFAWRGSARLPNVWRYVARMVIVLLPMLSAIGVGMALYNSTITPVAEESGWGEYTPSGEPYTFDVTNPQRENGEHVWAWIALEEADRAWQLRSNLPLSSNDGLDHPLRSTLFRYLTAMHVRKDSAGVMALSDADVKRIEQGFTFPQAQEPSQIRERFDEIAYEIGQYKAYGGANGHSITMRLEFKKVGMAIARENWAFGVGTGDTQLAFTAAHSTRDNGLAPQWWLRAHDQYLTWTISFGIIGLLWILFSLMWPALRLQAGQHGLFIAWATILALSNLSNDTLETQAGATFFALYYALFVFAAPKVQEAELESS